MTGMELVHGTVRYQDGRWVAVEQVWGEKERHFIDRPEGAVVELPEDVAVPGFAIYGPGGKGSVGVEGRTPPEGQEWWTMTAHCQLRRRIGTDEVEFYWYGP